MVYILGLLVVLFFLVLFKVFLSSRTTAFNSNKLLLSHPHEDAHDPAGVPAGHPRAGG